MEPAVLRKRSIRFSLTETRITFVGDALDGTSYIVPIFARRVGVKTTRLEGNLKEIGFANLFAWGPAACEWPESTCKGSRTRPGIYL
jgi:hypothetical protein